MFTNGNLINKKFLNDFEQCSYNSFVTTLKRKITGMSFISRIYIQMKKYLKRSSVKTSLINGNLLRKVSGLRSFVSIHCTILKTFPAYLRVQIGKVIKVSDPLYLVIMTKYKWEAIIAYDHD